MTDTDPNANDGRSADELPETVVDEVERLTRLTRRASDDDETALYRRERDRLLNRHGFTPRFREEDDTLVCYPNEWVEDGTAQLDRIEDPDRASEITLSGPGDPDRYDEVEAHNAEIVEAVTEQYSPVHGANARAFADFMGNHYVKQVERATADEIAEFREEYFPRNAWPSDEQRDRIAQSLAYVFELVDASLPPGTQLSRESE